MIILLISRKNDLKQKTEDFLNKHGVRYNAIIFNVPYGERILINDNKPSGLRTAVAVEKIRVGAVNLTIVRKEEDASIGEKIYEEHC